MDIVSISDFCKHIDLFPKQKEILESFYGSKCRELVAILGRLSGKDFLASIMALYEAYRLLQIGDPYIHYGLAPGHPIYIMLVSVSADQSKILFQGLKSMLSSCPWLKSSHVEGDKIYFKIKNNNRSARGSDKYCQKGSVCIMSCSANSDSILGKAFFALILNEAASFKNPERIYSALSPSTSGFRVSNAHPLDSHIITFSSPRDSAGIIYNLVSIPHSERMTFQLATWEVNNALSRELLREENNFLSDEEFDCEFGAKFLDSENQTISLRIPSPQIETLKRIARFRSYEEDIDISYIDLIRDCIDGYINNVMKTV